MTSTTPENTFQWKHIAAFLALTFGLTWLLDLLIWLTVGYANALSITMIQLQMLIPAFSALVLMMFAWKSSPIHVSHHREKPRFFLYVYLGLVVVFGGLSLWGLLDPGAVTLVAALSGGANMLALMALVTVRMISDHEEFETARMVGGKIRDWLLWGLGFILFYSAGTALNALFNLGQKPEIAEIMTQLQVPVEISPTAFFILMLVQTVFLGSLLSVIFGFGEEFGWRGFLQNELFKAGKVRGVIVLGLIWGVWHYPLIWMGHTYPGQPVLGSLLMTVYTMILGAVLSFVMLKTRAIWLVAFLHALNNQVIAFLNSFVYQVNDPVNSFTYGVWFILLAVPVLFFVFRDPVWKESEVNKAV